VAKKIEVQIVGDASSLQRALGNATDGTSRFGSALTTLAKTGALAAGAAGIGAIAVTLRQGIKEYTESAKVAAQTNAVIESTGQIANVTAKDVDKLAESLMRKSGVDDEVIKAGENMLLTFTKVRNEVGRGNDIFNQATLAATNVSVALGKDLPDAAMLVGKALNDPIKGMTAMTRAGIQFTDAQKDQIKAMVESGDVMGAQKVILKELETQFGGSAEAIGKTLPGQLAVLKESFNNFAGDLVAKAIPSVQRFVDFLNTRLIPAEGFTAKLKVVWEGVSEVGADVWSRIKAAVEGDERKIRIDTEKKFEVVGEQGLADKIKEKFDGIDWSGIFDTATGESGEATDKLTASIGEKLQVWALAQPGKIASDFRAALNMNDISADFDRWIMTPVRAAASNISIPGRQIGTNLVAGVRGGTGPLLGFMDTTMRSAVEHVTQRIPAAFSAALAFGSRIVSGIISGLGDLVGKVRDKLDDIPGVIRGIGNPAVAAAGAIGRAIVDGIISGASGLGSRLAGKLISEAQGAINSVRGFLKIGSPSRMWAEEVGVPIAQGITVGAAGFLRSNLSSNLAGEIKNAMGQAKLTTTAAAGGAGVGFAMKGGIDDFLENKLPDNLAQVLGLSMDAAMANFTQAGLGVTWSTPTLPAPPPSVGLGPSRLADPDAGTIVVNISAPIGSERDLEDMVRSALVKATNRGGLGIG
jgi:hypothetical protein